MRLLRLTETEITPRDRVYWYSRTRALLLMLILLTLAAVMAFYAVTAHWWPGYYIAAVLVLGCELMRRFVGARFRSSNWLVRMNNTGLSIQFRSYLNYHLPAEDLTVVFVAYPEIRSARLVREHTQVRDPASQNLTATQTIRYVELELGGDVTFLQKALQAERKEKAPNEKRWYGNSSTLYEDYPVQMLSPPFLRMRWQVVPSARKFLDALRPYTIIADPVLITQDFAHLEGLSREEQLRRLRELADRGQIVAAIYTARRLYGYGLTEAKQMVENLK